MYKFTPSLQSCITQFQGISSWLLVFNNLSKDWCWGRWPFQWYIIHHQCGLCPLQWWEWCGSMNIYSWPMWEEPGWSVGQHTHVCTHTLMCDRWWHQCPGAVTSLTASILVEIRLGQKPKAEPEKGHWDKFNNFITVGWNTHRSINQSVDEKRSNRGGSRQDLAISDQIITYLFFSFFNDPLTELMLKD